jgi:ApaG protein
MSDATTQGIRIQVRSAYLPERSAPGERRFLFAYFVRISNVGDVRAQLVSRTWIITDADGNEQQVTGPGVVGEQPVLDPGETFEYSSFCPLPTPVGSMRGAYRMVTLTGDAFEAEVAPFTLATPNALN